MTQKYGSHNHVALFTHPHLLLMTSASFTFHDMFNTLNQASGLTSDSKLLPNGTHPGSNEDIQEDQEEDQTHGLETNL